MLTNNSAGWTETFEILNLRDVVLWLVSHEWLEKKVNLHQLKLEKALASADNSVEAATTLSCSRQATKEKKTSFVISSEHQRNSLHLLLNGSLLMRRDDSDELALAERRRCYAGALVGNGGAARLHPSSDEAAAVVSKSRSSGIICIDERKRHTPFPHSRVVVF